jgi:general secretion pathway protein A
MSEQHREALAHLVYGFNSDGGFVLLTGDIGTGKTTVCRCLLEQIPENADIAFMLNPKLTVEELLANVCDEFGIQYPQDNSSIKVFVDLINSYLLDAHTKGRKAVIIIDEAQNLSTDVLEQLRLLTNLETNQCKLLQIILLGQPELRDKLSKPELQQLSQRIIARYHLGPLSKNDIDAYVTHRLAVAGLKHKISRPESRQLTSLFPDQTIDKLYELSRGIPRLINIICDRSLLGTFTQGKNKVTKSILTKAADEVSGENRANGRQRKAAVWILAILVPTIVGVVLAASYYDYRSKNSDLQIPDNTVSEIASKASVQPVNLQRIFEQTNNRKKVSAYQTLFRQWDVDYNPIKDGFACEFAQIHDLQCLNRRGNLRSLLLLNRPAVLKLFDDQNRTFYATLTALNGETASLLTGTETRDISIKDIDSHWLGEYTLLWQIPPNFQGHIQPGKENTLVPWVNKHLASIQGRTIQPKGNMVFDDELVQQVKKFQLNEDLITDGIVGTKTIIHLNTYIYDDIPKLTGKREKS